MGAKMTNALHLTAARRRPSRTPARLLFALCLLLAHAAAYSAQTPPQACSEYKAETSPPDREAFPHIRFNVSVTDSKGNAIPDSKRVKLLIQEGGKTVAERSLSDGLSVSSVLVLDTSGSMTGEKLQQAKEAAKAYIRLMPDSYRFALVGVSSSAVQLCPQAGASPPCGFSGDKAAMSNRIDGMTAGGSTAFQDGLGVALDLLRGRTDRKAIVALTDGREGGSQYYVGDSGRQRIVSRESAEKSKVYTIGLGQDVDAPYLSGLTANGGKYLFSPSPAALRGTFEEVVKLIQREQVFEYDSPAKEPDGLERKLKVELMVDGQRCETQVALVAPGVIPHVRGSHAPYVAAILFLMIAPGLFALAGGLRSVHVFRSANSVRLDRYSPLLGKRDPNVAAGGRTFREGDVVVLCPSCPNRLPHHIRSWRFQGCGCQFHPGGSVCYHRRLPRWLRHLLDSASGRSVSETGRSWLCRCAGDTEGY